MCGFPLMPWRLVSSSLENPGEEEAVQQYHKTSQTVLYFNSIIDKHCLLHYVNNFFLKALAWFNKLNISKHKFEFWQTAKIFLKPDSTKCDIKKSSRGQCYAIFNTHIFKNTTKMGKMQNTSRVHSVTSVINTITSGLKKTICLLFLDMY